MTSIADLGSSEIAVRTPGSGIDVLYVTSVPDDPATRALTTDDRFDLRTTTPEAALDELSTVDCVVARASGDVDAVELLDDVRRRRPDVPFVLFAADPADAVVEAILSACWTDYVPNCGDAARELLRHRVREVVEHRRAATLSRRVLAGIETARDGVAVVGSDGDFEFVSRMYATQFGYAPESLLGKPLRTVYTETGIEQIEDAIPALTDGWRWAGECEAQRRTGEAVTLRISLVGLDDGSMVFAVRETTPESDET